jgi:integrase
LFKGTGLIPGSEARPKPAVKNGDDELLEKYLNHRSVTGYKRREALDTFAMFKGLVGGKLLKHCNRDDGRKLVTHYQGQGLKRDSIRKRIMWLSATFNFGVAEGELTNANPFSGILPKGNDALRKEPFDEADIRLIKRNLEQLSESDALLVRLVASTGMRLSEALAIEGEKREGKVRYVIIGKKTESSLRRVPLPAGNPPIKGKLFDVPPVTEKEAFEKASNAAGKRINKFLRSIGIVDPAKTEHSFRHRAADRLLMAGGKEARDAIGGWGKRTVADGYGTGYPVATLKKWMDQIGF